MSDVEVIHAPPGWGWRPGARLTPPRVSDLPALPLLRVLTPRSRQVALEKTLRERLDIAQRVHPDEIARHYGMPRTTVRDVIDRVLYE